jgi:hypothetical protein
LRNCGAAGKGKFRVAMSEVKRNQSRATPACDGTRSRPDPGVAIRAYANTIAALVLIIALFKLALLGSASSGTEIIVVTVGLLSSFIVLAALAFKCIRIGSALIWTPIVWLPLQSAVFFCFGPLVEIFGNPATQASLSEHRLAIGAGELLETSMLSMAGVAMLLSGVTIVLYIRRSRLRDLISQGVGTAPGAPSPWQLTVTFVLMGVVLKYAVVLPSQWGMLGWVVPGTVTGLIGMTDLGFGIAAFLAARRHRLARIMLFTVWPIHIAMTVLTFSKFHLVIALLLPALGGYLAHRSLLRLIGWFAIIAVVFAGYQSLVQHGRSEIMQRSSNISDAGYVERAQITLDWLTRESGQTEDTSDRQGWWTRLSYAGPQAYAMELYAQGQAGRSLESAWMYFIPRAVWPSKPIMYGPGLEFYKEVTGSKGKSFLGLSIYGDLYWQYGWSGVLIGSSLIGILFGVLALRSLTWISAGEFIYLPVILLVLEMALTGPTKYVVNGIVGPIPIYVGYCVFVWWLVRVVRRHQATKVRGQFV